MVLTSTVDIDDVALTMDGGSWFVAPLHGNTNPLHGGSWLLVLRRSWPRKNKKNQMEKKKKVARGRRKMALGKNQRL